MNIFVKRICSVWIFLALASVSYADDWPMLMGNPQHTGQAQASISRPLAIKNLTLSWQYSLYSHVSASPVVVDNQLLVAAENGNLYAFDLTDKKLRWIYHTEAGIGSTPAVTNGIIYFLSRDGFFTALTQADGKLLWRFATQGEKHFAATGGYGLPRSLGPVPDPWDFYLSSPLVHDGKVYVGSSDHHVYALDAITGNLLWKFASDDVIHSSPAYADNKIFIGSWGTRLYALDAKTGKKIWDFQGKAERGMSIMLGFQASPTVDRENVYIGGRDGFFYALRLSDGTLRWTYDAQGTWILSTAAVDDSQVYFATSDTGLFIALDKKTGQEKYRSDTRLWTYTSPLIVQNQFVFVGTMSGELYGYDKNTGEKLWYFQTPEGRADITDILDGKTGKLRDEKLFAANKQLQGGVEEVKSLGAFIASPIWVDNQLIAVSANGEVLTFEPR